MLTAIRQKEKYGCESKKGRDNLKERGGTNKKERRGSKQTKIIITSKGKEKEKRKKDKRTNQ